MRIVRYSDTNNWGRVGQFFAVRPEHNAIGVFQYPDLYPPQDALAAYAADGNWDEFKAACRPYLSSRKQTLARLVQDIGDQTTTFLVSDEEYERSYEWMIEQFLMKGFRYEGVEYRVTQVVERNLISYTPDTITELKPHQIFVFGSNTEGRHGKGAAELAMRFGAIYGQAKGLQGQSYAIITKDLAKGERSYPLEAIDAQVTELLEHAKEHPENEFLVTKLGCGLAGYNVEEIARLFLSKSLPGNIRLPKEFHELLYIVREEVPCTKKEVLEDKPSAQDNFVTLHIHSHYSDGSAKVPEIVQAAAEAGNPAIALTDHGTMMGAIDLIEACQKFGVKPIVGNEMYLEHPFSAIIANKVLDGLNGDYKPGNRFHQIVLAKSLEGYRNLSRLTTWSELENKKPAPGGGKAYPLITVEKLKEHSEGLIVTSGCIGSLVPQLIIFGELELAEQILREYQETFGEDYYIELQHHDNQEIYEVLNLALVDFAQKLGIEVVISPDTHYLKECHYEAHQVLYAIKYGKKMSELKEQSFKYDRDLFFASSGELGERFGYLPQEIIRAGLDNTLKIAEKVEEYNLFRAPTAPEFPLPPGVTAEEHLRSLACEGLANRFKGKELPDGYEERLEYELGVIHNMGFDSYFLVVHDYMAFAKSQGIPTGMGRGSAAGSLVAYALGITGVDPIHHGLLFERFLNPERKSMPDIDSDFCQERRNEVIDYVIRKYGRDRVAQIGTVNTLSSKAVVKDVGRVLDISISETDAVSKMIPVTRGKPTKLAKMISEESPSAEFRDKYHADSQFKRWIDLAIDLEANMKTYGTHAAGVVIANTPLSDIVPLMSNDGVILTQYTMEQVEKLGFLKMDFLGLKTLTVLNAAARAAEVNKGITIELERIDRTDPRVFDIFKRVDLDGVFQFESSLFQSLSEQLQPDNLEDLSSINALARPGALDTGMTAKFVESKKDLSTIHYDHPDLEPLLSMTYGQAIYQEQILKIVQDIGGFSLGEADLVRRACGKKKADVMKGYEDKFMAGCVVQGYSEELGRKLWDYILASAEYIFNKSHSMAYGYIAYDCAWFKTYHRAEFMAALVSYEKKREKISRYLNSSKRHGVKILPPDINLSGLSFTPTSHKILFGLKAVKHLGEVVINSILKARQDSAFTGLIDFCLRTEVDVRGLQALIKCGAFDNICSNRKQLSESVKSLKKWLGECKTAKREIPEIEAELMALRLRQEEKGVTAAIRRKEKAIESRKQKMERTYELVEVAEDFTLEEKLKHERDSIGFFVSGNPVTDLPEKDLFPVVLEVEGEEINEESGSYKEWITASCAIVEKEHKIAKKNGNPYCEMILEDHAGTAVKCMVYKKTLEKPNVLETIDNKLAFIGKFRVDRERDTFKLTLNTVL